MLKLAGVIRESIVDGPGLRFVVFAQGCPHHCPECHNPQTWSLEGGFEVSPEEILLQMKKNPLLQGITLSGGEPFWQSEAMAALAAFAKAAGFHVLTYTGYTLEQLLTLAPKQPEILSLLSHSDILVDGPFISSLKGLDLGYRGSSNQRIIKVAESLQKNAVVQLEAGTSSQ